MRRNARRRRESSACEHAFPCERRTSGVRRTQHDHLVRVRFAICTFSLRPRRSVACIVSAVTARRGCWFRGGTVHDSELVPVDARRNQRPAKTGRARGISARFCAWSARPDAKRNRRRQACFFGSATSRFSTRASSAATTQQPARLEARRSRIYHQTRIHQRHFVTALPGRLAFRLYHQ